MDKASILVTGGCGLQGSHIVEKLRAKYPGAQVAVLSRNPTSNTFPGVAYHRGDITRPDDIARCFAEARPDVVFHVAGAIVVGRPPQPAEVITAIHVDGTRYMLEESRRRGVKAFVFTSSASVIQTGGFADVVKADETWETVNESHQNMGAQSVYSVTKAESERLVLAADDAQGMRTCSLRPAALYGERDTDVTGMIMATLRAGRHRTQLGDNTNLISVTYVGNSADAHVLAAEKLLAPGGAAAGVAGEAFFVTGGQDQRFWDFSRALWRAAGTDVQPDEVWRIPTPVALAIAYVMEWVGWARGTRVPLNRSMVRFSQMTRTYDISKARQRLGYVPAVDWQEGVERAVKWYLENEKAKPVGKP